MHRYVLVRLSTVQYSTSRQLSEGISNVEMKQNMKCRVLLGAIQKQLLVQYSIFGRTVYVYRRFSNKNLFYNHCECLCVCVFY